MDERSLTQLLRGVAEGDRTVDDALEELRNLPYEGLAGARIDHHRELRTGQAEAVFAPGKTLEQVRAAAAALVQRTTGPVFVTRATPEQFHAVREVVPAAEYHPRSGLVVAKRGGNGSVLGSVAVVSAGTSDQPVAEEASATASALAMSVDLIEDVGVAGIHRLLDQRERIDTADCVVVVAGMEGALPSVVAGLTSRPVIAVPTSVGYGASFEGLAALLAMLSSCAPGIAVVNIDNGFGAALVAHRILRTRAADRT
ncbi:MAG: nickel pincer cofactor biosynthesis protein LarB [Actinomycetota bacterium]|nr:nickel pincer cofactor biosynthesis protein LarB [Actinomycetota bacterium]